MTTYICSTQQLNYNSLQLIPTPPLIVAVNIGAAECRPFPSEPPWEMGKIDQKILRGHSCVSASAFVLDFDLFLGEFNLLGKARELPSLALFRNF